MFCEYFDHIHGQDDVIERRGTHDITSQLQEYKFPREYAIFFFSLDNTLQEFKKFYLSLIHAQKHTCV